MQRIAIVGAGPTGLYTLFALVNGDMPVALSIFEQGEQAGVGMPYNDDENIRLMLANIASIEIPPLTCTYLDWLQDQDVARLARYGVKKDSLHDRQFLPRILLGEYFRDQFLALVAIGRARGFPIDVHESCAVTDIEAQEDAILLWAGENIDPHPFDRVVIATGHVWPDEDEGTRAFFPSPWSGLLDTPIAACRVGIMGTSLSAIDAAMAVAAQHGRFIPQPDDRLRFDLDPGSRALTITLMSRSGILPEADFYCPIPYEPLMVATPPAIAAEIAAGEDGLLNRVFALAAGEIAQADPAWSARVGLDGLDADSFADAYFADRHCHAPFRWAEYNLAQVQRNKADRHTVPWRYAILRLHEAVQEIVPHLGADDRARFDAGLSRVFIDNYAAIPSESIRRLLALHAAGVIDLLALGTDYDMDVTEDGTTITVDGTAHHYAIFIDARGQKPLETNDLPFPKLKAQLLEAGDDMPDIDDGYMLQSPAIVRGRIAFGAIPYLMRDHPFTQGITASADIGATIAAMLGERESRSPVAA